MPEVDRFDTLIVESVEPKSVDAGEAVRGNRSDRCFLALACVLLDCFWGSILSKRDPSGSFCSRPRLGLAAPLFECRRRSPDFFLMSLLDWVKVFLLVCVEALLFCRDVSLLLGV